MKDAMGRLGLLSPTRARLIARAMATTASSCPITRLCSVSSIFTSLSLSSLDTCTQKHVQVSFSAKNSKAHANQRDSRFRLKHGLCGINSTKQAQNGVQS